MVLINRIWIEADVVRYLFDESFIIINKLIEFIIP